MEQDKKKQKIYRFTMAFSEKERRKLMLLAANESKCVSDYIKELLKPMFDRLEGYD